MSELASRCAESRTGPDGLNDMLALLLELAGEGLIENGIKMGEGSEEKRGVPPVHGQQVITMRPLLLQQEMR